MKDDISNLRMRSWFVALLLSTATLVLSLNPAMAQNRTKPVLVLDFSGYQGAFDGRVVTVPPYDTNGNPAWPDGLEQIAINEIKRRVQEDFSPFHIQVDIQWPTFPVNRADARIIIGGSRLDSGVNSGRADHDLGLGVVPITAPCVGPYPGEACEEILDELLEDDDPANDYLSKFCRLPTTKVPPECPLRVRPIFDIAASASHEAAHLITGWNTWPNTYSLAHYDTDSLQPPNKAALMGTHLPLRDTWWYADEVCRDQHCTIKAPQDDIGELMAVLGPAEENAGLSPGSAPMLRRLSNGLLQADGVIAMNEASLPRHWQPMWCDVYVLGQGYVSCPFYVTPVGVDYWRFNSQSGEVEITVYTANGPSDTIANLLPGVELWRKSGSNWRKIVPDATDASGDGRWIGITTTLSAGDYAIGVKSVGTYGDLGQYRVTVEVPGS